MSICLIWFNVIYLFNLYLVSKEVVRQSRRKQKQMVVYTRKRVCLESERVWCSTLSATPLGISSYSQRPNTQRLDVTIPIPLRGPEGSVRRRSLLVPKSPPL